jgi:hypothetical protein
MTPMYLHALSLYIWDQITDMNIMWTDPISHDLWLINNSGQQRWKWHKQYFLQGSEICVVIDIKKKGNLHQDSV